MRELEDLRKWRESLRQQMEEVDKKISAVEGRATDDITYGKSIQHSFFVDKNEMHIIETGNYLQQDNEMQVKIHKVFQNEGECSAILSFQGDAWSIDRFRDNPYKITPYEAAQTLEELRDIISKMQERMKQADNEAIKSMCSLFNRLREVAENNPMEGDE